MPDYVVFGGRLRSALVFPELRPAVPGVSGDRPDWTLAVGPADEAFAPLERLGAHRYPGDVEVALLRGARRWRVATSDLGDFDLDDGGAITWRPRPGAREDLARFDLLGRVLPLALHRDGALVLHGSSVTLGDGAVAFLAPKGHGKSTLALLLAQRGARLLSDDATVLRPDADGVLAHPGVHAVRLWDDAADRLAVHAYGEPGLVGRKLVVTGVPEALRAEEPAPLRAVYLLRPPDEPLAPAPGAGDAATRTRLGATEGAVALVRHTTAGGLLGGSEAPRVLERAAAVARRVPVYALAVARDLARLGEAAAVIERWHLPRVAEATA
jgi:hypothetical protein